ncbi:peptidoglycan-binding domain-containing protein [Peribacillus muralis]|nr:peptidoglycan-binding domain-containing protein [Peribacillus muralis]
MKNFILRKDAHGVEVRKMQDILKGMGFYTDSAVVDVDGIFRLETEAGVKKYQKENYLKVDGVLGPRAASLKILRRMSRTPMEQAEIWGSELNELRQIFLYIGL